MYRIDTKANKGNETMKLDDLLKEILAEAEAINPDAVARIYGSAAILEQQYFESQKDVLTKLVDVDVFEDATDPPRVMVVAALGILKHSFTQAMANLIMIGALDPKDAASSVEPILTDLGTALHEAAEQAIRVAENPRAHGFEEAQATRRKG